MMVGLFLCAVTEFTLLWPAMTFCLGVCAEALASWERPAAHEVDEQARARWEAAYYCGTHDWVFLVGRGTGCSPEQFAQLLRPAVAGAPPGGPESGSSQPRAKRWVPVEQEGSAARIRARVMEPRDFPVEQAA
jgi:hypothetical protein